MFLIRRAAVGDEAHLARLAEMVQGLHVAQRPDLFTAATVEDLTAWYRSQLETSTPSIWMAKVDGTAVGYVLVTFQERASNPFVQARRWCELDQLAVAPAWRRRGVGRALVHAVLDQAASRGVADIELTVWDFNEEAKEFFRGLGFSIRVSRLERKQPG